MDIVVKEKGVVYGVALNDFVYARDVDNNEVVGAYAIKFSKDKIKIKGDSKSVIFSKFGDSAGYDFIKIDGDVRRGRVLIPRWWAAQFLPLLLIENYKFLLRTLDLDTGKIIDEMEVYKVFPLLSRRCGGLRTLSLIIIDRDGVSLGVIEDGKIRKLLKGIRGDPFVTKGGSVIFCTGSEKVQRYEVVDCDGKVGRFNMRSLPTIVTAIPVLGGALVEIPRSDEFSGLLLEEKNEAVFTDSSIALISERGSMRFLERGHLSLEDAFRRVALVYNFKHIEVVLVPENVKLLEINTFRDGALIDSNGRVISLDWETDGLRVHTL